MPHLTASVSSTGALLRIHIGPSRERLAALKDAGKRAPPLVSAWALIDTGAERTVIDLPIVAKLGLVPTGTISMHTPSTGSTPHETYLYDVGIHFYDDADNYLVNRPLAVTGVDLSNCGCEVLIGIDLLSKCLLVFDGRANTFALAF